MTPLAPPPFPTPIFQKARRITGHVLTQIPSEQAFVPPPLTTLERKTSVAGHILLLEDTTMAYTLQRKIKDTMHGSVRVGFVLNQVKEQMGMYELVPNLQDKGYQMVSVHIYALLDDDGEMMINEIAALQWITNAAKEYPHLLGPVVVAKDTTHMYMITPFHKEGSLFDYCGRVGRLSESEGRYFFRQILQGLEELKELELCHRGLDLDSISLNGTTCVFSNFEHTLRIPVADGQIASQIAPQEPHGKNPQNVAPELLKSEAFDGNAVDLWSAGIILFQMLLGGSALFDAPIPEDPKYDEICVQSNLKGALQRWMPNESHLSAEAMDLLERMLIATPTKRLMLSEVQNHPWVKANDVSVPDNIIEKGLTL